MTFSANSSQVDSGSTGNLQLAPIADIDCQYFKFEAVVRSDNTLIIHLKGLREDFRNERVFNILTKFISDRIGQRDSLSADFIGSLYDGNKSIQDFNSLDIFVKGYAPMKVRDHAFVVRHICQIGSKLIEFVNRGM